MRFRAHFSMIVSTTFVLTCSSALGGTKLTERLTSALGTARPADEFIVWISFADKGSSESLKRAIPHQLVTGRSLERRRNVRPERDLLDYTDLPVEQRYLAEVSRRVYRIRQVSKWLNATSAAATKGHIVEIEQLPFVREIDLVARFKRDPIREYPSTTVESSGLQKAQSGQGETDLSYGQSFNQVNQLNVPAVHNTGNYAQGVIVGVFDNGFRLPSHEAFSRMKIIGTRDFVDHKTSVVPNNQNPGYGGHGHQALSVMGGYKSGTLIGPAFGASFLLARTENDSSETPFEEDNWAAAIEWAESLGVQVTSTSLGYLTYDPPYNSWTWQDMNGSTTVVTRAANIAAQKGVVVLNSAGNNGSNSSRNTLNGPADGFGVIAVGAVDPGGKRLSFSSVGPTTDLPPRIKPDVMAQGSGVYSADPMNTLGYAGFSGTSAACPLAAGAAALIVHAHPRATPTQIADAMRMTASQATTPDYQHGWGIVNALAAINYLGPTSTADRSLPSSFALDQNFPNPFNPTTTISFQLPRQIAVTLSVYNILGEEVARPLNDERPAGKHETQFDATRLPSGVYFYRITAGEFSETKKMMLVR